MNREEMCSAVLAAIEKIDKPRILVAIDGRCGSGKTTLAAALQEMLQCPVVHMDDFFLRPRGGVFLQTVLLMIIIIISGFTFLVKYSTIQP